MNAAVDYQRRAEQYKPSDPALLAREMRRMVAAGFSEHDVATALHIAIEAVRHALQPNQEKSHATVQC